MRQLHATRLSPEPQPAVPRSVASNSTLRREQILEAQNRQLQLQVDLLQREQQVLCLKAAPSLPAVNRAESNLLPRCRRKNSASLRTAWRARVLIHEVGVQDRADVTATAEAILSQLRQQLEKTCGASHGTQDVIEDRVLTSEACRKLNRMCSASIAKVKQALATAADRAEVASDPEPSWPNTKTATSHQRHPKPRQSASAEVRGPASRPCCTVQTNQHSRCRVALLGSTAAVHCDQVPL